MGRQTCTQIKSNGDLCGGYAIEGSPYCFFHDPASAERRAEARSKGGKSGTGATLDEANTPVRSVADIVDLIEMTINDVRAGRIDVKIANAVGYLANISMKAFEQRDVEKRLEAIESVLEPNRARSVASRRY